MMSSRSVIARRAIVSIAAAVGFCAPANADMFSQIFGDVDLLNQSSYPDDPTAGATLFGLAPNVVTFATNSYFHGNWPFTPEGDDLEGTDRMYAGAFTYSGGDGYSNSPGVVNGIQSITIDYSSLIPDGHTITSFTLGIAADDFQFPMFGNEFVAGVNSSLNSTLSSTLNSLNQTGPFVQFFTIGIDPTDLRPDHTLTFFVRQADTGNRGDIGPGDGWAVDFLYAGIETVPTPGSAGVISLCALAAARRRRR